MKFRSLGIAASLLSTVIAAPCFAWGSEGHILVAAIARSRLSAGTVAKVDAILAQDKDASTSSDMLSRAVWADVWRAAGHRETSQWHFADVELDHPDLDAACFGHPPSAAPASTGPENSCIVDRLQAFASELGSPSTSPGERILALKYVLHFVGDMHQPLHMADNHDRGGNCVTLALGGPRTINLHGYWDTVVVGELGKDAREILGRLTSDITPERAISWSRGDIVGWARETNAVAVSTAYSFATPPRCESSPTPLELPAGYDAAAQSAVAVQLERAGVRLAVVLEKQLGPLSLAAVTATP
jgi:S1/P1 Nuclease